MRIFVCSAVVSSLTVNHCWKRYPGTKFRLSFLKGSCVCSAVSECSQKAHHHNAPWALWFPWSMNQANTFFFFYFSLSMQVDVTKHEILENRPVLFCFFLSIDHLKCFTTNNSFTSSFTHSDCDGRGADLPIMGNTPLWYRIELATCQTFSQLLWLAGVSRAELSQVKINYWCPSRLRRHACLCTSPVRLVWSSSCFFSRFVPAQSWQWSYPWH